MSLAPLDVYDNQNGSVQLAWGVYPGAASYNVYVNGALNQNVAGRLATVNGLTVESYASGAAAAPSGNSQRPQNMPPGGVVTPSGTYTFRVAAVVGGNEAASVERTVTVSPTSIMLTTSMRRPFPFPNTAPGG